MVVGNKKDLEENRVVEMLEAAKFAQENECLFMETSAMTGENVEEVFNKLTHTIIYKLESGEIPEEVVVVNRNLQGGGQVDLNQGKDA